MKRKAGEKIRKLKYLITYLSLVFLFSVLASVYLIQMTGITGHSMEPELKHGQRVLVNKFVYGRKRPERFDIIVFRYLYEKDGYYVKRIIGLPGETVQIRDGSVYINSEKLKDPYEGDAMKQAGRAEEPLLLGEEEYFVLGDNRNESSDSRGGDVGNVKKVQILGKAFLKLWPVRLIHAAEKDRQKSPTDL